MDHTTSPGFEEIDSSSFPLDGLESNTTPGTEYSPPFSPIAKVNARHDCRTSARNKLVELSLEEKVRLL
jgi:beta-glucosidase